MGRESYVFYESFWKALENLNAEDVKECLKAISEYALYGKEPDVSGIAMTVFVLVKPQIDANNKRYENGKKGGRPKVNNNQDKTKAKPNNNQNKTKSEPNVNVNDNVNVNVNVNDNDNVNVNDKKYCYGYTREEWENLSLDERMKIHSERSNH